MAADPTLKGGNDFDNLSYNQIHLRNFINARPAINISQIEIICDIPTATLRHFMKERRKIPEKYFDLVVAEMAKYGFQELESE